MFQNPVTSQSGTVAMSTFLDRDNEQFAGQIKLRPNEGVIVELLEHGNA
jgi:hypothetical protein